MSQLTYALISPQHRSQILFTLAHQKAKRICALFSGQRQKKYFEDAILNTSYSNITILSYADLNQQKIPNNSFIVLMEAPSTFEDLKSIINTAQESQSQLLLLLLKINKKYINMIEKKIDGLKTTVTEYSPNKFVGINDKLREFTEKNYDLNRAGFYAYGEYINYFRSNLLKKIFKTEDIEVAKLAVSFGFSTPPRVKQGKFLTKKAQIEKKVKKQQSKITAKTQQLQQKKQQEPRKIKKQKKISKPMKKGLKK